jgi:hypothetical protein
MSRICGAKNRRGLPCHCKLLYRNGRCRFHGGLSTGPRTAAGLQRTVSALKAGYAAWMASKRAGAASRKESLVMARWGREETTRGVERSG